MTSEARKIPPILIIVFAVSEIVMFGAGYLIGQMHGTAAPTEKEGNWDDVMRRLKEAETVAVKAVAEREAFEADAKGHQAKLTELNAELEAAKSKLDSARGAPASTDGKTQYEALEAEVARLRADVETRDRTIAELKAPPPSKKSNLTIPFGKWSEDEGIANADWNSAGDAASHMLSPMKKLADELAAGKNFQTADQENIGELTNLNLKLLSLATAIHGKMPTHAKNVNGSFAHPLVQFNVLAGALNAAGVPLSDKQLADLTALGDSYEELWTRAQDGYSAETLHLVKFADELELKLDISTRMEGILTNEQKAVAFEPSLRHSPYFDIYSPALMLQMSVAPTGALNREQLRGDLMKRAESAYGLTSEQLAGCTRQFDDFLNATASLLTPLTGFAADSFTAAEALTAARGEIALINDLILTLRPAEEAMNKIREHSLITMPRIIKAPAEPVPTGE